MTRFKQAARSWIERRPIPLRLVQDVRTELHLVWVRLRGRLDPRTRRQGRRLRRLDDVMLHFGCGTRVLPGWINVDGWAHDGVDFVSDLRLPLPFKDGACRLIFTEHVLEHVDRQFRPRVMRELYRLLKPGGTLRIVVPHCGRYAEAYARDDMEWFRRAVPGCETRGEGLNSVFVDHFHRFIDDFETLARALNAAGFTQVIESKHMESAIPELHVDSENEVRTVSNLYVEARK